MWKLKIHTCAELRPTPQERGKWWLFQAAVICLPEMKSVWRGKRRHRTMFLQLSSPQRKYRWWQFLIPSWMISFTQLLIMKLTCGQKGSDTRWCRRAGKVSIKMYRCPQRCISLYLIKFYQLIRVLALKSSTQNYFKIILSLACKILSPNPSVSF